MGILGVDNIGIAARDVVRLADFFEVDVGLPVERTLDAEPPSAQVDVGDEYLYIFQAAAAPTQPRSFELTPNPPGLDHVSFTVNDVDATWAELRGRGVTFEGEPATMQEWGIRLVGFRDPEGNSYFLVQRLA